MISEQLGKTLDSDFEHVLSIFQFASQFDRLKQRYVLIRLGPYCQIPCAEFLRLYSIWLAEGGVQ